jgi:hypothetical protein
MRFKKKFAPCLIKTNTYDQDCKNECWPEGCIGSNAKLFYSFQQILNIILTAIMKLTKEKKYPETGKFRIVVNSK